MSKVIGGIFSLLGLSSALYIFFLYRNSPAYLEYNAAKQPSLVDTGLLPAMFVCFLLLSIGLGFMFFSVEPNKNK